MYIKYDHIIYSERYNLCKYNVYGRNTSNIDIAVLVIYTSLLEQKEISLKMFQLIIVNINRK